MNNKNHWFKEFCWYDKENIWEIECLIICCWVIVVVLPLSFSKQKWILQSVKKIFWNLETDKFLARMAPLRFNIPLQRKDLLRGASDGQYWVENEYSIRELKTKLVVSLFLKLTLKFILHSFVQSINWQPWDLLKFINVEILQL